MTPDYPKYVDEGTGPALILNHGTGMDLTMFDPQIKFLTKRGYRVIAMNSRVLLGDHEPHTLADLADDTLDLAERLGLKEYVVGGMSVGAFSALEFALRYNERALGYVLIAGQACAYPDGAKIDFRREFSAFDTDRKVIREQAEWMAPFCFDQSTYDANLALVEHWVDRWTALPARSVFAQFESWIDRPNDESHLKGITRPVLIVHGEHDLPVPIERAYSMFEELRDASFAKIAGAGHTCNLENPEPANYALLGFLNRVFGR